MPITYTILRPSKIYPNWDLGVKTNHLATLVVGFQAPPSGEFQPRLEASVHGSVPRRSAVLIETHNSCFRLLLFLLQWTAAGSLGKVRPLR
jgi:hypothetical protein